MKNLFIPIVICLIFTAGAYGQKKNVDPAAKTDVMKQTLNKIKNVQQLDKFIAENKKLKQENKGLKGQITALSKQVAKLTNDLKKENERMKKQLLQLPSFKLKSKIVGKKSSLALLEDGDRTIRVRTGTERSVLVKPGVYVLMKVEKISTEGIVLHFPELDRRIKLYD